MILTPRQVEVRHWHIFCGLGGGARGFNLGSARVGNDHAAFRCLGGVDSDRAAIEDFGRLAGVRGTVLDLFSREQYTAFHGHEPPEGWREATPVDIQRSAGNERPHIAFGSAPCLPAGGLVLTALGPRRIDSISAGTLVLTHKGRYRQVMRVGSDPYVGTMYGVRVNGSVDIQEFTADHPIWRRKVIRRKSTSRKRALGAAEFVAASELRAGDRVGFPVDVEQAGTAKEFVRQYAGHPQSRLATNATNAALWFIVGAYLGDGYRRGDRPAVAFCVGDVAGPLAARLRVALSSLGLSGTDDTWAGMRNVKIWVNDPELYRLLGAFGDGADRKDLPPQLMALELPLIEALIDGYRSTDGSEQGRRQARNVLQARWKIASISLQLLRSVQRLLLRVGTFASIHHCWPGGRKQLIEGRTVDTKPRWELNVRLDPKKRTVFEFADGCVWIRVRTITRRQADETVWNLEVNEDDTFCSPLIATHNCKGFSGLLSQSRSASDKYQALNQLALRGLWLALEAWKDDPPEFWLWENVPRIQTRGRAVLDQMVGLLEAYGYSTAETTHDCGELGGLAQSRKRFLLVARHREKVPPFLYEPPKRPLRPVGDVLGALPLPSDPVAGPMHRMRALQWRTWVRLAFVDAGSDWRSLNKLHIEDGYLADFGIAPEVGWHRGVMGVTPWDQAACTVTGRAGVTTGRFAVADPRPGYTGEYAQLGVNPWDRPMGTVSGQSAPGGGAYSVADPRLSAGRTAHYNNIFRVVRWADVSQAVTGPGGGGTAAAVADPRTGLTREHGDHYLSARHYGVLPWDRTAQAVTAAAGHDNGAFSVADPRCAWSVNAHQNKLRVVDWHRHAPTVAGGRVDSGALSVADPRCAVGVELPAPDARLVAVIRALDNTWHRPFTTLELAALQSLIDPAEYLELQGASDTAWRERIGNAVPSAAAKAVADVMGTTLLLAWSGETFALSAAPIWVQPIAVALSVKSEAIA